LPTVAVGPLVGFRVSATTRLRGAMAQGILHRPEREIDAPPGDRRACGGGMFARGAGDPPREGQNAGNVTTRAPSFTYPLDMAQSLRAMRTAVPPAFFNTLLPC
jgi:hypothetical protein